jgi:hypothetical protein
VARQDIRCRERHVSSSAVCKFPVRKCHSSVLGLYAPYARPPTLGCLDVPPTCPKQCTKVSRVKPRDALSVPSDLVHRNCWILQDAGDEVCSRACIPYVRLFASLLACLSVLEVFRFCARAESGSFTILHAPLRGQELLFPLMPRLPHKTSEKEGEREFLSVSSFLHVRTDDVGGLDAEIN